MVYQLIESYGVIGDLHTVALVGMPPRISQMRTDIRLRKPTRAHGTPLPSRAFRGRT